MADDSPRRTRIDHVWAKGYRSLYDVDVSGLGNIVVLHGRNGAGKSNLMRVPELVLRLAAFQFPPPASDKPAKLGYVAAEKELCLLPSDFSHGREKEMALGVSGRIGEALAEAIGIPHGHGTFRLGAVVQDTGREMRFWFHRADALGGLGFSPGLDARLRELAVLQAKIDVEDQVEERQKKLDFYKLTLERLSNIAFGTDAERGVLLRRYEAVRGLASDQLARELHDLYESEDIERRRLLKRLNARLSESGLLGSRDVELHPVHTDDRYDAKISRPECGDLPFQSLGTGQQQWIQIAKRIVTDAAPITLLEEPEVHMHKDLMIEVGKFLLKEVEDLDSPLNQLWISTHHHAFALAPTFLNVEFTPENGTTVAVRDRAQAAEHFYEPGPLWEALRSLAEAMGEDDVVLRDMELGEVTAKQILDDAEAEGSLARRFAEAATRSVLASMVSRKKKTAS